MEEEDFIIFEIDDDDNDNSFDNEITMTLKKIRWITGLEHTFEISDKDFKNHIQLKDWCLEQCSGKVVFFEQAFWGKTNIHMYFYDKDDAIKCKLAWG